jgi:hypothetical protein
MFLPAFVVLLASSALAQAPAMRCDLDLKSTPGAGAGSACLDLAALQAGGAPIRTAGNATRIGLDGFRICKDAFTVTFPARADIVFIYDNSGSMMADFARIDSATGDTLFFHNRGCGGGGFGGGGGSTGPLVYQTVTGPRTVQLVDPTRTCQGFAGDPFNARSKVIAQAIDFLARTSPQSSAGAVSFADVTAHEQPPLPLSTPGNADIVKASLAMDSIPDTRYGPPLRLANTWLANPALDAGSRKAIVFISDGAPNDDSGPDSYLDAVGPVPIYSLFLGNEQSGYQRLQEMSTSTGGQFHRVDPDDVAAMNRVMEQIIQAITVVEMPRSVEITNSAWPTPMVSRSTQLVRNADSSVSLVMDSVLALKQGSNPLTVKITLSDAEVREYSVSIQADGPAAPASEANLVCHPQPVLSLLNAQGGKDTAYHAGPAAYDVVLTRSGSDLAGIAVTATSRDSARPAPWGDDETILLGAGSASGALTVHRRDDYAFNGGSAAPVDGNSILEGSPDGYIILSWSHPRDPREAASLTLPGPRTALTPGFIEMKRVGDVTRGIDFAKPIVDPLVLRGGAAVSGPPGAPVLAHKGILHNPHGLTDAELDPRSVPTYVFKTASPFSYKVTVYDHLGQFLFTRAGTVDSLQWERMREGGDSLAVAMSIVPVAENGQRFATGVYLLHAVLTTSPSVRQDPGRPMRVTPASRALVDRFGYLR